MPARIPQLLSLRPTSPLPIASGEYGRALLRAYERVYGPSIGSDVAFAVEKYAKAGGYFPHRNAGTEGLQRMQTEFGEHLRRNAERFAEDFGGWIEKTRASFPPLTISADEAARRCRSVIANNINTLFDRAERFHDDCFRPLINALHSFGQTNSAAAFIDILRVLPLAEHDTTMREYFTRTRSVEKATADALFKRPNVKRHIKNVLSTSRHTEGTRAKGIVSLINSIKRRTSRLISRYEKTQTIDTEILSRLAQLIKGWPAIYALLATTAYRMHLVHTLEQIDREVLAPLEELIEQYSINATDANLGEFEGKLYLACDAPEEVGDLWDARLDELRAFLEKTVPNSEKVQADISRAIHSLRSHRQNIGSPMMEMSMALSDHGHKTHKETAASLVSNIMKWRRAMHVLASGSNTMSALEYAEGLGARVVMEAELPEEIDDAILHDIFDYPIGNALDINNKSPRQYPNGEEFEIVVTVRADSIEIRDNGPGMTPERLAEVRRAIAEGKPLKKSDHGGLKRGLAVDVGRIYLRQLFPNSPDHATLTIDSTLGEGTTVTIHYPKSVVAAE